MRALRSSALILVLALTITSCSAVRTVAVPVDPGPGGAGPGVDADQWTYADSLEVTAPPDLPHPALPPCAARPLAPGWVVRENALLGDPHWRPVQVRTLLRVPLYLDQQSTVCGEPVTVHLGGRGASAVTVRAYRVGWYAGAGARLVWTSAPVDVPRDFGQGRHGGLMPSPGWPTTVTLPVDAAWTPGQYLIESWDRNGVAGVTSLIVRDDADHGGLVVVNSNLTWAAYSQYGASSLYKGTDGTGDTKAQQTSLQRPVTGAGADRLMVSDVPLTQFLEEHGIPARHILDTDLDAWPSMATSATALLLPGHSEYWTRRMYDAALAARNAGVNIADFGANEVYWQARLQRDPQGVPLTMTVDRTLAQDPLAATHPDQATVRWVSPPLNRDPSALIGERYSAVRAQGSLTVWSLPRWLAVGTRLHRGALLRGLVANEADGVRPGSPATPPDVQTVLLGMLTGPRVADQLASTTYYSAPSGAGVFAAGTTYWTCDLTNACPELSAPAATQAAVRAMTLDVLRGFARPRFGRTHPSVHVLPSSLAAARIHLPAGAVGRYAG